jgi:hypothetical protein
MIEAMPALQRRNTAIVYISGVKNRDRRREAKKAV